MKTPTDDQIKVAAYKVRQGHNQGYDEAFEAAVRAGYALAAKSAEDRGCYNCRHEDRKETSYPCRECGGTKTAPQDTSTNMWQPKEPAQPITANCPPLAVPDLVPEDRKSVV